MEYWVHEDVVTVKACVRLRGRDMVLTEGRNIPEFTPHFELAGLPRLSPGFSDGVTVHCLFIFFKATSCMSV